MILPELGPERSCPLCGGDPSAICEVRFATIARVSVCTGYEVSLCPSCGFGFANRCPNQRALDRYHSVLRRYVGVARVTAGPVASESSPRIAEIVAHRAPEKSARIVVVGPDSARIVDRLEELGFGNAVSAEPPTNGEYEAKPDEDQGIITEQIALAQLSVDLLVFSHALSRNRDLKDILERTSFLLKPGGQLYVEEWDAILGCAERTAPFEAFGVDRFNFFSTISLGNLMAHMGFVPSPRDSPNSPATAGWFEKAKTPTGALIQVDRHTGPALQSYVDWSREEDLRVREMLRKPILGTSAVCVWGAGSETLRLVATGAYENQRVAAFIDSSPRLHGSTIQGIPVLPPVALLGLPHPIIVGNTSFGGEIEALIRAMGCDNEVLHLHGHG